MKIVSFFNHKGGVGKTTLVYNIGLAMGVLGHRVLFVDVDPQANLTTAAIAADRLEKVLQARGTIFDSLRPLVDRSGDIEPIAPTKVRENAWIIPGNIGLSDFEEIAPTGWTEAVAGNSGGFRTSTALFRLVSEVGREIDADFALLDLGPNVGALNRTAILASSGFVIPLAPDLFSIAALSSVGKSASLWVAEWVAAKGAAERRKLNLGFALPEGLPSPLGYISQQFAIYRQEPAEAYRRWISQIPGAYRNGVIRPLREVGARIPPGDASLGEVRNLSSLVPIAQRTNQAIFELGGSEARGAQYTRAKDTYEMFSDLAKGIIGRLK